MCRDGPLTLGGEVLARALGARLFPVQEPRCITWNPNHVTSEIMIHLVKVECERNLFRLRARRWVSVLSNY
jgi:hypothetical protein